ncbi:ribosomal protein L1 [Guyanagaster necrorhizus]|uniref:Ribosomal L1 domain-containing protein 1 n=1 Tax=Guyanagaster necrorhizus TaxID=856835 RepID=A0A9P8AQK0_9AGAR|nr:ribosomal protein L1 [Guyanagaster necrorhizus MCA 3950]KAG7444199.1 ribosomal protein L1 [Guyanagaster necrorhizus MCA 3950]
MAGDELIDSRVSVTQCERAVDAIHAHQTKKTDKESASELLPGKEQTVWLNVAVKKVAAERKIMPVRIPVVHPIVDPRTSGVCLITKDPQREYKDLLEAKDIKFISRVVGISKLKGKFKPYEARRILLKEHGLFLADDRVIPLLPKLLGEKWFRAKKQPIPVTMTRKDLKKELEHAVQSTYMNQNRGTNTAIKIGNMSHTPAQILANLKTALPVVAKRISGGWDNIQALSIKTNSSVSLPIWSCSLGDEDGGRWAGLGAVVDADAEDEDSDGDDDEAMKVDEPASKKPPSGGKKRAAADDEVEETSKPKKKAKATENKSAPEPSKSVKGKAPIPAESSSKKEKVKAIHSPPAKVSADSSKKSKVLAPNDTIPPVTTTTPSTNTASTNSSKSKKLKAKASSDASVPVPAPGPSPASETKKLKKKASKITQPVKKDEGAGAKLAKKHKSVNKEIDTPSTADDDAKNKKASSKETVLLLPEPAPVDESFKKDKKRKKAKSAEDGGAQAPVDSLTADDLKKKRSVAPGEKKKDKVVKAKGGKSAKNEIIGKKSVLA